jgi:hypothetical protein
LIPKLGGAELAGGATGRASWFVVEFPTIDMFELVSPDPTFSMLGLDAG